MNCSPMFTVIVAINRAHRVNDDMLGGIMSYVKTHTSWNLILITGRRDEQRRLYPKKIDGVVIGERMHHLVRGVDFGRIPAVVVAHDTTPDFPCCHIHCDSVPIAAAAAQHLLSKHCKTYAFVHSTGKSWSDIRGRLFAETVAAAGGSFLWRTSDLQSLPRLLSNAPKPLGVFSANDILARATLDACRVAGCNVPDDVLILGVDNDAAICEMSTPTI